MENTNPNQIGFYLEGSKYPARKQDIINRATRNEADEKLVNALEALAEEQVFESPMEIARAVERIGVKRLEVRR